MSFRRASWPDDVDLLLRWRNEDEQKAIEGGWYDGALTTPREHRQWWTRTHSGASVKILIWRNRRVDSGMIRVDSNGELAFHGDLVEMTNERMLGKLARDHGGRLKATIDTADTERGDALLASGFVEMPARFFRYRP